MIRPPRHLAPAQAAARLGVSAKALRLYEREGLLTPGRSAGGWRLYGAEDLSRAAYIVSLRTLGLGVAQIAGILDGDPDDLDAALAAHEHKLRTQERQLAVNLQRVRTLRDDLRGGTQSGAAAPATQIPLASGFALPWPWGGEWFDLGGARALNYITGALGSGKTRLAERLAAELPDAAMSGLDRFDGDRIDRLLADDVELRNRVEQTVVRLEADGATCTRALRALVASFEADQPAILVVDMVEEGLDDVTQQVLISHLRGRASRKRAAFLMTRSSSILNLDQVGDDEAIIICPANHSPPFYASTRPGGHGYEAVATCLAPPAVRARTPSRCYAGP